MPRTIAVSFVNLNCATVAGFGSRELLTELRGRSPVFSSLSRAWVVQPHTARDAIAVAESRGWQVVVIAAPVEPADDQRPGLTEPLNPPNEPVEELLW